VVHSTSLPDELRRAIEADSGAVRPLPGPVRRALLTAAWLPAAAGIVLGLLGMRSDSGDLGPVLTWGPTVVEALAGLLLVALALGESVPGLGVPRSSAAAILVLAGLLLPVQGWLTHASSPDTGAAPPFLAGGVPCLALQLLLGLPALAVTAFSIVQAAPLAASWAGVLAGAGAGLLAEAVYHLHCPATDLPHVLVFHGGAVVVLALLGLAAGALWERAQRDGMRRRLEGRRIGTGESAVAARE
jgi:hypothetical protein